MNDTSRKQEPNVLVAISNIAVGGGAEKVATTVANEFLKRGINTKLLTFYTSKTEHEFRGERISMGEATPATLLGKLPRALSRILKVRRTCNEEDIDVIISFLEESNYYILLSKLLLFNRRRVIVSVRNDPRYYPPLYQFLIRVLYPFADKIVAVTKGIERVLKEEYSLQHTTTIYNPLNYSDVEQKSLAPIPEEYRWLTHRSPLFITIGRLTDQKGHWHLIRAFSKVVQSEPDATLVIIGEGPLQEPLQNLIQKQSLTDRVFLIGKQRNIYPFLQTANAFVLPSVYEGMPNVLLEAVATGLPAIATDASTGAREILAPNVPLTEYVIYPYHGSYGTLTAPFAHVCDIRSTAEQSLSENELQLAQQLLQAHEQPKSTLFQDDQRFKLDVIVDSWIRHCLSDTV